MKYCVHCGAQIKDEALICPKCGCPTPKYKQSKKKTPIARLYIVFAIAILATIVANVMGVVPASIDAYANATTIIYDIISLFALAAIVGMAVTIMVNLKEDNFQISMSLFIFIGALLFIAFCFVCKQLSQIQKSLDSLSGSSSYSAAKASYESARNRMVFLMLGYLASSFVAVFIGTTGLCGKLSLITKKAEKEDQALEEITLEA